MGRWVKRRWESDPGAYGGRQARASFVYEAFIPDPIAAYELIASFSVAEAILSAERAVEELNEAPEAKALEAIGALLLRSESIASSRIEGYVVSTLNLARALVEPSAARGAARVVAGNVLAMETAIAIGDRSAPLTTADISDVHRILLAETDPKIAGEIRTKQNWIGGRLPNPADAAFIPPPPEEVPQLLEDLVTFLNRTDTPAIAQAGIGHAQFETIHPFADGNGRVGRALIHLVLRRRGLAPRVMPPISLVLAARPSAYVAGLTAFREGDVSGWCDSFAETCAAAARNSRRLAVDIADLEREWLRRARPRSDSAAARILRLLPAQPVVSAGTARGAIGTSHQAALTGLKALEAAGILRQISGGTYDRIYAADELLKLVEDFERSAFGESVPIGDRDTPP